VPGANWQLPTVRGHVRTVMSTRADGDFHLANVEAGLIERRRRALVDLPWTMLDEVHGTGVVHVARPGDGDGAIGDVAVTDVPGAVLGVWVADCAPVVLADEAGVVGAVHAGWRGLAAGVLPAAVGALRALGAVSPVAVLGPCVRACCYEFGADDLAEVEAAVGTSLAARTAWGTQSLDIVAAVMTSLSSAGVRRCDDLGVCTRCDRRYFSHRRGDRERQVVAVWIERGVGR
jgi:hypothetical protein